MNEDIQESVRQLVDAELERRGVPAQVDETESLESMRATLLAKHREKQANRQWMKIL